VQLEKLCKSKVVGVGLGGQVLVVIFFFKSKTFSSSKTISSNIITVCD